MINKQRQAGQAAIAVVSGLVGVLVGAFILFILFYSSGLLTKDRVEITQSGAQAPPPSATGPAPQVVEEIVKSPQGETTQIELKGSKGAALPAGAGRVAEAVAKAAPAVVNIDTTITTRVYNSGGFGFIDPFDFKVQEIPRGMGTGVIVSDKGIVLTNNHVVSGARTIRVTLSNKSQYKAKILGTDPVSDLAILQIENPQKETFPTATLTNSEKMRIGDWVVALGNPLGVGQTATLGILSARNRSLSDSNVDLRNLLQTDAAINPGNSGGPLINLNGEVIGINTAIIRSAQGIGFAIPAETAHTVMNELLRHGRVSRPFLGIEMADLTPPARHYLGLDPKLEGVIVGRVMKGSPADEGGIKSNDVIVSINGSPITSARELQSFVRSQKVGTSATLKLWREGEPVELSIKWEELPSNKIFSRR